MHLGAQWLTATFLLAMLVTTVVHAAPRVVRVGVYENPPKLLADPQGQPSGILGDMLREVARLEEWTLEQVPCEWERCLRLLEDGEIDLMPDVAFNESRAQRFDFHRVPALSSWSQMYRRPGVTLQSVLDLEGKRVVVLDGSVQQEYLAGLLNNFALRAELVPVKSFDEAFGMVAAGEADAVATNHYSGDGAASRHGLSATTLVFLPSKLFFATDKGRNADLLAAIDARLDAWQSDASSFYFQTLARWGQQASQQPRVPLALWWGLAAVLGLLLLSLGFVALLRREVARQTLALSDSEQRFRNLAEHSVDWIWAQGLGGRYTYSNPGTALILGYRTEDFLALDPRTLVHPEDLALFEATNAAARARRTGWRNVVIRWRHRDGGYRVLETNAVPVLDAQGELQGFQGVDRDITERTQGEQERQRLAAILESTSDIVGMADAEGRPIYMNGPGRALLGRAPQGDLSESIANVHPKWAADLVRAEGLPTAIREGRWSGETAVLARSGEEIPVSQVILSHKDPQGKLLFFSTIMRDIRASRAAQQALQHSEQRLREAQQLASLGNWELDLRTGATYWSDEVFRIFELDPARVSASYEAFVAAIHPDDRAEVDRAYRQSVAERSEYNVVHRLLFPDGRIKHVRDQGHTFYADDGTPLRSAGTALDITERVQAERALRESEERLRLAPAAASQGLYDLDLTTGDAKVSPEYATMLGYDPATFVETNAAWRERLHPDDEATVYKAFEDYVSGRLPEYHVEFRQRTRDGDWKWILSLGRIQERAADGSPLRLLGTHTDIDAIKRTEAALRELNTTLEARVAERTAELTAANQELETFAYAVSHDLRAPLRAMSGFSSALQEDHAASLPSEAKVYVEQIVLAGRKMSDLVEGLLTLSRSTRGDLRMDRVDVSALAQQHLAELAAAEPARRVLVEVEPGLAVQGDGRMISSVLDNLLDNAWKYTCSTAQPKIRVYGCTVEGRSGFCVSDNGAGFDMAHAARLFKAFQRLHRQDEFPGIGIGLATVQRIVQRHGGQISAHGVPGQGATFSVELPAKAGQQVEESET